MSNEGRIWLFVIVEFERAAKRQKSISQEEVRSDKLGGLLSGVFQLNESINRSFLTAADPPYL